MIKFLLVISIFFYGQIQAEEIKVQGSQKNGQIINKDGLEITIEVIPLINPSQNFGDVKFVGMVSWTLENRGTKEIDVRGTSITITGDGGSMGPMTKNILTEYCQFFEIMKPGKKCQERNLIIYFSKSGEKFVHLQINPDRAYSAKTGKEIELNPGNEAIFSFQVN